MGCVASKKKKSNEIAQAALKSHLEKRGIKHEDWTKFGPPEKSMTMKNSMGVGGGAVGCGL